MITIANLSEELERQRHLPTNLSIEVVFNMNDNSIEDVLEYVDGISEMVPPEVGVLRGNLTYGDKKYAVDNSFRKDK